MIKLHLGCGKKYLGKDWIHIDIINHDNVDIVCDIKKLTMFKDSSIDEIYACHVFEHFQKKEVEDVLKEWFRILKKEGILRISVPDFESIAKLYCTNNYNIELFNGLVCGGQKNEYDFHYNIYDEKYLTIILKKVGFIEVRRYDWRDFLPENYDDYSRAYIPHMDFDNGILVSLNILAKK